MAPNNSKFPAKKRRSSTPGRLAAGATPAPKRAALAKSPAAATLPALKKSIVVRPLTTAQIAAAEAAKKKANAVQVSISFNAINRYQPGLKILLSDSIYLNRSEVCVVPDRMSMRSLKSLTPSFCLSVVLPSCTDP